MDTHKLLILIPSIRQDLTAIAKLYDELKRSTTWAMGCVMRLIQGTWNKLMIVLCVLC